MERNDGRQTRAANDVGRPDRSAKRAPLDGWPTWDDWTTLCVLARAWATTAPEDRKAREKAECAAIIARCEKAFAEGLRSREAAHGEAAPDAQTAVAP